MQAPKKKVAKKIAQFMLEALKFTKIRLTIFGAEFISEILKLLSQNDVPIGAYLWKGNVLHRFSIEYLAYVEECLY